MGEAVAKVESVASDPAPVTTHVAVGIESETNSSWEAESVHHSQVTDSTPNLPVMIPGIHAAQQIKTCHLCSKYAIESFLTTDNNTVIEIIKMLKSTCWALA